MKKNYDLCLFMALILTVFLLAMSGFRKHNEALASRIAPEVLRFHVLANSDTPEDQALKLEVKELLLDEIRNGLSGEDHSPEANSVTKEAVIQYVRENQTVLEQSAETFMAAHGFDYPAEVRLETCDFPQKTYGDMTFPAGTYDAVRVVLGTGEGQNFWCVLYPSLCYIDSTYAVVPDSSKELLQTLIPEADFQSLLLQKNQGQDSLLPQFKIRFKFAELFRD